MYTSKSKKKYSSRSSESHQSSSPPPSELSSSPAPTIPTRKRSPSSLDATADAPVSKRRMLGKKIVTTARKKGKGTQKKLTQLHLAFDDAPPALRACSLCGLTYTVGAPDDEALHRTHCARVQRGLEWGREEERERERAVVTQIRTDVRLKDGRTGRIVCFRADAPGRVGAKFATLMETINRALSSPPLSSAILAASKAYVFLVPHIGNKVGAAAREQIVGCVVAQRISTAMALTSGPDASQVNSSSEEHLIPIHIDATTALYVQPTPLPTPLGISRLFVSAAHRRQGVAESLLDAAAETFIHGCPLDPALGHVAFTQPTNGGQAVMQHWGKGGVRIYEE